MLFVSPNCGDLFPPNVELKSFPDGESSVRLPALAEAGKAKGHAFVLHRCYPDQDKSLVQLMLLLSALKRHPGVKGITAIVPYLPYARQDKAFLGGEPLSAYEIVSMLKCAGCSELVTFDCHFLKKEGTFEVEGLKIRNLSMGAALKEHFKPLPGKPVFSSPDKGASYLSNKGYAMSKERGNYVPGSQAYRKIARLNADFDAGGKTFVLIDDMVAGGGTMLKAIGVLKEKGAKAVYVATVHGLLLNGADRKILEAGAKELVCTDSIRNAYSKIPIKKEIEKIIGK